MGMGVSVTGGPGGVASVAGRGPGSRRVAGCEAGEAGSFHRRREAPRRGRKGDGGEAGEWGPCVGGKRERGRTRWVGRGAAQLEEGGVWTAARERGGGNLDFMNFGICLEIFGRFLGRDLWRIFVEEFGENYSRILW